MSWEGHDFERTAESCKMNKCRFEPALLKKAVLFVQRWCGQQTFHVLRVAILIYKFHAAFLWLVLVSICEIDVTSFSEDGRGVK